MTPDLFDWQEAAAARRSRYPYEPGAQARDTSIAAAEHIRPWAKGLRSLCKGKLRELGPSTADEVAVSLGKHFIAIRPRLTELAQLGEIRDTGQRRKCRSGLGRPAIVWEVIL
jgi:hypothetical protein